MCLCLFISALELFSVSTALPTIANALHTTQFTWIGSAYALSATAFLPMSGNLAQTFGRRPAMLITLGLFALCSGICGGAKIMTMFIVGRSIQGLGGGGIQSLTGIILADIVTLQERGVYAGLYGLQLPREVYTHGLDVGSNAMLMMNLISLTTSNDRGNFLVTSATVAYTIGFLWGGVTATWTSAKVLAPVMVGLVGFIAFIAYEATIATHPIVPFSLMTNSTSVSGYIQTFCNTVVNLAIIYFFPVYFQACKGASPIISGVYSLAFASLAPAAILAGLSVKLTGRYRPQIWIAWTLTIIALGLMTTVLATDPVEKPIGYLLLFGWGTGMLHATFMYPIQAPLPVMQNASAFPFTWFLRSFATVWGITIGSTVLQNELVRRLPTSYIQSVPQGTAIMYSLIPELSTLPPQMRFEVEVAFAGSLAVLWRVLAVISGAGFVASLFMRGHPLHNTLN
ncbi:hypothetical protein J3R82DRAFT_4936 [Butyriboletus roseoflavus]|nr:hypothetical protein J3R82DRAFT_4936 [Butyriboletus roseoflavus]